MLRSAHALQMIDGELSAPVREGGGWGGGWSAKAAGVLMVVDPRRPAADGSSR